MYQRFLERYQMWRGQKADEERGRNPLSWLAFMFVLFLALDAYKAIPAHQVAWRPLLGDAVLVTFLVLYLRHSRFAWLVIPLFGVLCLVQAPILFFSSSAHYPARVRLITFCLGLVLGAGALAYGFVARRKYERYLEERSESSPNI